MKRVKRNIQDGTGQRLRRASWEWALLALMLVVPTSNLSAQIPSASPEPGPAQAPSEPAAEAPVYDGDWWLSLGGWEQYGVISGYEDCYTAEYRGSFPFTKEVQSYADDVNKYYLADPERRKKTVSEALDAVRGAASDSSLPISKSGNFPSSDQGVYDGRFWFDADSAAQLGFVEGYLACHTAKVKDSDGTFYKAPSEYVDLINKEYEITDDSDDIAAEKASVKIADVLHKLKDEEAAPPKPAA